ncbi:MAG: S8 family serine peptidase [Actinomycetota bacterium]
MRRVLSISLVVASALFFVLYSGAPAPAEISLGTYIVTFDALPTTEQIEALSATAVGVHGFAHLPAAVVVAAPVDLRLLANLPGVRKMFPNYGLVKMLNQSTRAIRADQAWDLGYTGAGVGIAVIDTGIDGTHPDLCAAEVFCRGTAVKTVQNVKIIGRADLLDPVVVLENQLNTDTSSGHGTHVAGIAAGLGVASTESGKYRGVANGARLIGLGTGEAIEAVNVLAAYDWVIEHAGDPRYNIKVINNSWGPGAGTPYDPEDPVNRATDAAWNAGISVTFGAGNEGPTADTMNAFSVNPKAISVAAGENTGHVAFFSSRGVPGSSLWHPTLTAPGYLVASDRASTGFYGDLGDITSTTPGTVILPPDDVYYAVSSGTSMASPHVAGVVALIQQAAFSSRGSYLSPAEVKNLLQNTAVSRDPARGPGGLPNYQSYTMGAGYADALAAVQAAAAGTGTQPYNDGVTYDVRTFSGQVGPAAVIPTQSFETTFDVLPGAVSLDVMVDWTVKANDVDIDLYNPAGAMVRSTFLVCDPTAQPNGYSSFCTNIPNERITAVAPMAGQWRALVHGTASAVDTASGMWSVIYPDGTLLPPAPAPATITIATSVCPWAPAVGQPACVPTSTSVPGQDVRVTATVHDESGNPIPNAPVTWTSNGVGYISTAEIATHADGVALATAISDYPGTQTVAASSGAASASTTITWLGVQIPGYESTPGRASGGGWILDPNKRTFGFYAEYRAGELAPAGELSFDDHDGTKVKAAGVSRLIVSGSKATVTGSATVNGNSGYSFKLEVTDNGQGRTDTIKLKVTNILDLFFLYETSGTLGGGNIKVEAY